MKKNERKKKIYIFRAARSKFIILAISLRAIFVGGWLVISGG